MSRWAWQLDQIHLCNKMNKIVTLFPIQTSLINAWATVITGKELQQKVPRPAEASSLWRHPDACWYLSTTADVLTFLTTLQELFTIGVIIKTKAYVSKLKGSLCKSILPNVIQFKLTHTTQDPGSHETRKAAKTHHKGNKKKNVLGHGNVFCMASLPQFNKIASPGRCSL